LFWGCNVGSDDIALVGLVDEFENFSVPASLLLQALEQSIVTAVIITKQITFRLIDTSSNDEIF
jgi:hypothetical protein